MSGERVARAVSVAWLVATTLLGSACRPADAAKKVRADSGELAERQARFDQQVSSPDSATGAIARWVLPRELDEVSGFALTADGRLLAHGDERVAHSSNT